MKPIHGEPVPKNIPSDMVLTHPIACEFAPGDRVIYTNDYGVKFTKVVKGFSQNVHSYGFIYIDSDAYWMPVKPEQLKKT